MAVDGKDCDKDGECGKTELTPNYDLTAIKEIRFGYSNPKESSKALLQIDEVKFFNTFMEIPGSTIRDVNDAFTEILSLIRRRVDCKICSGHDQTLIWIRAAK